MSAEWTFGKLNPSRPALFRPSYRSGSSVGSHNRLYHMPVALVQHLRETLSSHPQAKT